MVRPPVASVRDGNGRQGMAAPMYPASSRGGWCRGYPSRATMESRACPGRKKAPDSGSILRHGVPGMPAMPLVPIRCCPARIARGKAESRQILSAECAVGGRGTLGLEAPSLGHDRPGEACQAIGQCDHGDIGMAACAQTP